MKTLRRIAVLATALLPLSALAQIPKSYRDVKTPALHQVPLPLGLAHQALAIAVLTLAVVQVERLARDGRVHLSPLAGRAAELNDSSFRPST